MIFPGMDPYLEDSGRWPSVHHRLIVHAADFLVPLVRPRYFATIQERVYVEGTDHDLIPDVLVRDRASEARPAANANVAAANGPMPVEVMVSELTVTEPYLEILDRKTGRQVVTVLEIVSPTNKYAGPGRDSYRSKQSEVRGSKAHLVEIDLLRAGPHVLAVPQAVARAKGPYEYLVSVNRAKGRRGGYQLYLCRLRDRLPQLRIPLAEGDPDVLLDLQAVLERTYAAGGYGDDVDYTRPCVPPLPAEDQAWADERIRAASQRKEGST